MFFSIWAGEHEKGPIVIFFQNWGFGSKSCWLLQWREGKNRLEKNIIDQDKNMFSILHIHGRVTSQNSLVIFKLPELRRHLSDFQKCPLLVELKASSFQRCNSFEAAMLLDQVMESQLRAFDDLRWRRMAHFERSHLKCMQIDDRALFTCAGSYIFWPAKINGLYDCQDVLLQCGGPA